MVSVRRTKTTFEPVDIDDLKAYLKIDYNQEDTAINAMRVAAREWVEEQTSTYWAVGESEIRIQGVNGRKHNLYRAGFTSLLEAPEDAELQQNAADYTHLLLPTTSTDDITITAAIGTEQAPEPIRLAIMMMAGLMFANRTGEAADVHSIKALIRPYKKFLYI
jgi:hypothetical protein